MCIKLWKWREEAVERQGSWDQAVKMEWREAVERQDYVYKAVEMERRGS